MPSDAGPAESARPDAAAGQRARAGAPPRPMYFEAMSGMLNRGWAPLTGVLSGRDKFIDLPIAERYDLSSDPGERSNLAGRDPERDRVLSSALAAFGPALPGARIAEDPDAAARLRALGYVSGNAPRKAKYTEEDDPKRLVELDRADHRALDAFGNGRPDEAAALPGGHRAPPGHGHRLSPPGTDQGGTETVRVRWRCCGGGGPRCHRRRHWRNWASTSPKPANWLRGFGCSNELPTMPMPRRMR